MADDLLKPCLSEGMSEGIEIEGADLGVGEDKSICLRDAMRAEEGSGFWKAARTNENGVGTRAEDDINARKHGGGDGSLIRG